MKKGLVIGLGQVSEKQLSQAKKEKYEYCFACGAAINLSKNLKISKRILFLSEARLGGKDFWGNISKERKEEQIYNQKASFLIDYAIPDEIWIFHTQNLFSNKKFIYEKIAKSGFKGQIRIYSMRFFILDFLKILGINSLFIDNKKRSSIDILLSFIFNKKIKRFGLKIPSSGIISILACLTKTTFVNTLGISLDREYGYINNKRYDYPKLGRKSHIVFDREILKRLSHKVKVF